MYIVIVTNISHFKFAHIQFVPVSDVCLYMSVGLYSTLYRLQEGEPQITGSEDTIAVDTGGNALTARQGLPPDQVPGLAQAEYTSEIWYPGIAPGLARFLTAN